MSSVFDTHKGRRTDGKRTICEVIRSIYDICVCDLSINHREIFDKLSPLIEEAFIDGIKMNKRLCEYKINTLDLFPDDNDTGKAIKIREERIRLQRLIDENERTLCASK